MKSFIRNKVIIPQKIGNTFLDFRFEILDCVHAQRLVSPADVHSRRVSSHRVKARAASATGEEKELLYKLLGAKKVAMIFEQQDSRLQRSRESKP